MPVALIGDLSLAEKTVLARLDGYRMRGSSGRKNEWLEGISAEEVLGIVIDTLEEMEIPPEQLVEHMHRPASVTSRNPE